MENPNASDSDDERRHAKADGGDVTAPKPRLSSLDSFDRRIQTKLKEGQGQGKEGGGGGGDVVETPAAASQSDSKVAYSRARESFDDRLNDARTQQREEEAGRENERAAAPPAAPPAAAPPSVNQAGRDLDSFEARVEKKLAGADRAGEGSASVNQADQALQSFEARVEKKLAGASATPVNQADQALESFEARVEKKLAGATAAPINQADQALQSFEARVEKKARASANANRTGEKSAQPPHRDGRAPPASFQDILEKKMAGTGTPASSSSANQSGKKDQEENLPNDDDNDDDAATREARRTAAAYEEMEETIKGSIDSGSGSDVPATHGRIQASYENEDDEKKRRAAKMKREEEEERRGRTNDDGATTTSVVPQQQRHSISVTTSATTPLPAAARPPVRRKSTSFDEEIGVSAKSSIRMYHEVQATLVPQESMVYVGTPVVENDHGDDDDDDGAPRSWFSKNQRCIMGILVGLVVGLAVAVGVSLAGGSKNGSSNNGDGADQFVFRGEDGGTTSKDGAVVQEGEEDGDYLGASSPPAFPPQPRPSLRPSSASTPPVKNLFDPLSTVAPTSPPTACEGRKWYFQTWDGCTNGSNADSAPVLYDTLESCCVARFPGVAADGCVSHDVCAPTASPSMSPTGNPTTRPTDPVPTRDPTARPATEAPTQYFETFVPTEGLTTLDPTARPTTKAPTKDPTPRPTTNAPTKDPTARPTNDPTTLPPSKRPSPRPMVSPQDNSNLFSMNWEQQGQLIVEGTGPNELKPVVLSGDGTIMAIGGPGARENENRPGMVKVLRRGWFGSQWENLGRKIEGTANGDLFGTSLAFSKDGRTLAIGAPGFGERRDRPGYVRVYSMVQGTNGPGWAQLGDDIIGEANGDETGISVSLSSDGKTMAIGSSGYASSTGRVKIYSLEEGGQSWKQLGQDLDGEAVGDRSGSSVSLSSDGKMLAVGAWGNDGSSSNTRANTGHVRVHYIEEDGTSWKQLGQDIDGEDNSGRAVSFSADGKSLAVAAYGFANGNNAPAGRIRVYRMEENGLRWKQLGQEVDGEAVSLSEDGNIMAIGVAGNINSLGRVQVYVMEDDDPSWMQLGKAIEGEALGDNSRWSVNLSSDGKTVAIASHWNGGDRDKAGHVRVFTLN